MIGAGRHERAEGRVAYRNGYRDRPLDTRLGTLNLRVPKLRQGSYFPGYLSPAEFEAAYQFDRAQTGTPKPETCP